MQNRLLFDSEIKIALSTYLCTLSILQDFLEKHSKMTNEISSPEVTFAVGIGKVHCSLTVSLLPKFGPKIGVILPVTNVSIY